MIRSGKAVVKQGCIVPDCIGVFRAKGADERKKRDVFKWTGEASVSIFEVTIYDSVLERLTRLALRQGLRGTTEQRDEVNQPFMHRAQ